MDIEKWDRKFLKLAETISKWSKDPSTKVGAVIVHGKRVISLGFNGLPAGVDDNPKRYLDREFKLAAVLHAEVNAIMYAREDLQDCTIYTWPMPPCSRCAAQIIQSGITRVVSIEPTEEQKERWADSFDVAETMYDDVGVSVMLYGLRELDMNWIRQKKNQIEVEIEHKHTRNAVCPYCGYELCMWVV